MTDLASLGLVVDSSQVRTATSDLDRLSAAGARAEKASQGITRTWDALRSAVAAAGIGLGVRELIQYADTWKILEARVKLVTSSQSELRAVQAELFSIAQRTATAYSSTVELYARVARSAQELGRSQKELLQFTETVNQAIQVGGSSAEEAAAGVMQLGQALASGALRGDELRSVLENMPRLAQAIADGMGITRDKLRQLGEEGKLTSRQIFDAIYGQRARLQEEFGKIPLTVGRALEKLQNEILRYIGFTDQASGATTGLAAAIGTLAKNVTYLGDAFTALGAIAGAVIGGRLGLAALATLANPLTALVAIITAAGVAAYTFRNEVFKLNREFVTISDLATELWSDIKQLFEDGKSLASEFWQDIKKEAEEANNTVSNWAKQFNSFVYGIGNDISTAWDNAAERVSLTLDTLWQNFKSVFSSIGDIAEAVWKDIAAGFEAAARGDFSSIGFGNTRQALANGFQLRGFGGLGQQAYNNVLGRNVADDIDASMGAGAGRDWLYQGAQGPGTQFGLAWTPYAQDLFSRAASRGMARSVQNDVDAALGGGADALKLYMGPPTKGRAAGPSEEELKKAKKAAEELKKALADLKLEVDFGAKMVEAARAGASAMVELQAEFEATKVAQDKLGERTEKNAKQFDEFVRAAKQANLAKYYSDQTVELIKGNKELERSNELAAKELELLGARPEIRARELALLKTKLEFEARGLDLAKDNTGELQKQFDERARLLEQQELLTISRQQIEQARDLWLEPFRNAISGIQDMFAGMWRNILDGGVNSFKDLKKQAIAIIKELAVQILTLLTVRPVINFVVDGLGLQGALPGFGSTGGSGGGIGSILNLLSGGSSPYAGTQNLPTNSGGGLFGNLFGGGGGSSFLSRPISSLFGGFSSGGVAEELAALTGGFGGNPLAGAGFLDNLSIGSGLGAIGGVASGIMQLTQGGTANTIGGIASLIGAGVSLIPGVGQVLGPLISIAGGLFGGLFGGQPKIPKKKAQLYTGAPGIQTGGAGTIFQGTDFTYNTPFGVLGYYGPGTNKRFDDPNGEAGDLLRAVRDMDRAIAELLTQPQIDQVAAALQGRPGIGVSWKKAFDNEGFDIVKDRLDVMLRTLYGNNVATQGLSGVPRGNENIDELINRAGEVIQVANAIKGLGIETTAAEKAIKDLNEQFDELSDKAEEYGFAASDLAKIDAERRRQISKVAGDFNQGVADALLGYADPYALAQKQLADSQDQRRKEAVYLIDQYEKGLIDTLVDINKLEELFGKERVKLSEQYLEQLGSSWKDFVDGLLVGPLSAKSNKEQYGIARAEYDDVKARAQAAFAANDNLDPALAAEFQREAIAALQWSRAYNASSQITADLYNEILALSRQFGDIPGFASGGRARGGLTIVGERGPELLNLMGPAQITNAQDTARLLFGGGGLDVNALRSAFREIAIELIRNNADGQGTLADLLRRLIEEFRAEARDRRLREPAPSGQRRRAGVA